MLQFLHEYSWLIELILTSLIFPAVHAVLKVYKAGQAEQAVVRNALKDMLHDRIFSEGTTYLYQGYVTTDEFENFNSLCESYFSLNGNGSGHAMYEQVKELPFKKADYSLNKYQKGGSEHE